jgi:hypothetical protein
VTAVPSSSPPPSSRSGFHATGFPPPPKSVRLWAVPTGHGADELAEKLAGRSAAPCAKCGPPPWLLVLAGISLALVAISACVGLVWLLNHLSR